MVEADHRVVTTADSEDNENLIELVWRERLPLGLNLLLNDESGQVKVVDLPRGSQARKVCEGRGLDPDLFKSATIVAVNGCRFFEPEEVYEALRDPIRPKTVLFELAEAADAARVQEFVADAMSEKERKMKESAGTPMKKSSSEGNTAAAQRTFKTRTLELTEPGDLGIEFGESADNFGLIICGFARKEDGSLYTAEESGKVQINDLLTHINGKLVLGENGAGREKAFKILQDEGATRPLSLTFSDPYLLPQTLEMSLTDNSSRLGGPAELRFEEVRSGEEKKKVKRIVLTGFKDADGAAESGGIFIGDFLVFVNGKSVGAGSRWLDEGDPPSLEEVYTLLRNPAEYPMGLTFARPAKGGDLNKSWSNLRGTKKSVQQFEDTEAETVAIATDRLELLGCVFDVAEGTAADVIVTDFYAVPGFFQSSLAPLTGTGGKQIRLAVESINGQFVPSYASTDMVSNAMKRSWNKERRVEIVFSDDELKAWVHAMVNPPSPSAPSEAQE